MYCLLIVPICAHSEPFDSKTLYIGTRQLALRCILMLSNTYTGYRTFGQALSSTTLVTHTRHRRLAAPLMSSTVQIAKLLPTIIFTLFLTLAGTNDYLGDPKDMSTLLLAFQQSSSYLGATSMAGYAHMGTFTSLFVLAITPCSRFHLDHPTRPLPTGSADTATRALGLMDS